MSLPELGAEGQAKLLRSSVLLIGVGGLGCPAAQYLAAAGVGRLGLLDFDRVDVSNLQRQVLYTSKDVGQPKVEVARERIQAMNPDVQVTLYAQRLEVGNAFEILSGYDVIVDGSDNFPTRYLVNDACVQLGKPCVHGSVLRFEGQASVFDARRGPCYRCVYPEPPPPGAVPSCGEAGVLGVVPGLIALVQASEALKLLADCGESLCGRLLQYDALEMSFKQFGLQKDPACRACGPGAEPGLRAEEYVCEAPASASAAMGQRTAVEVCDMQERGERFLLLDVREPEEFARARIPGAVLIPLAELVDRQGELEAWREREIVVHCHHGPRSELACTLLLERGFARVSNLTGGIHAWSATVDSNIPTY